MFIYWLENSLIRSSVCVEFLGLKVLGMLLADCLYMITALFWTQVDFLCG